jgi:hypothetical protein
MPLWSGGRADAFLRFRPRQQHQQQQAAMRPKRTSTAPTAPARIRGVTAIPPPADPFPEAGEDLLPPPPPCAPCVDRRLAACGDAEEKRGIVIGGDGDADVDGGEEVVAGQGARLEDMVSIRGSNSSDSSRLSACRSMWMLCLENQSKTLRGTNCILPRKHTELARCNVFTPNLS